MKTTLKSKTPLSLEALEDRMTPSVNLIADLNRTPSGYAPQPISIDGELFFGRQTDNGAVLWKTDGTIDGTLPVTDAFMQSGVEFQGQLFFTGSDSTHGSGIWRTDGTANGTKFLKQIPSANLTVNAVVGNKLFFSGGDLNHELWVTDGTSAGTVRVKKFSMSVDTSLIEPVYTGSSFVSANGKLVFLADDGHGNLNLWQSNGTAAGTKLIQRNARSLVVLNDVAYYLVPAKSHDPDVGDGANLLRTDGTGAEASLVYALGQVQQITAANGKLWFTNYREPWTSDGTSAGTHVLNHIATTDYPQFVGLGTAVYFVANDTTHSRELWRTDGTPNGTKLVKDIDPGLASSSPSNLTASESMLYFTTNDEEKLWQSDGSDSGTIQIAGLEPRVAAWAIQNLTPDVGGLYFTADTLGAGREVWHTDGSETSQVGDLEPGEQSSNPDSLVAIGSRLLWTADTLADGAALWTSDGPETGAAMLAPAVVHTAESRFWFEDGVAMNGKYYFPDYDGLYVSDGTKDGTQLVMAFNAISHVTAIDDLLYFSATTIDSGSEPWVSDGTPAGTHILKDIDPGPGDSGGGEFHETNGVIYFKAAVGSHWNQLWRTDGTTSGTSLIKDFYPVASGSSVLSLPVDFNGLGYFIADAVSGTFSTPYALWRTDGTQAGTQLVDASARINSAHFAQLGNELLFINYLGDLCATDGATTWTVSTKVTLKYQLTKDWTAIGSPFFHRFGDYVYFNGYSTADAKLSDGYALAPQWRTDGTEAGTTMISDTTESFVGADDTLLFTDGKTLWKTDGNGAEPTQLIDLSRVRKAWIGQVVFCNGRFYFCEYSPAHGSQLWETDGTVSGTNLVTTFDTGRDVFADVGLTVAGNALYFGIADYGPKAPIHADDPSKAIGYSIWRSDGTASGTHRMMDGSSFKYFLAELDGVALIAAYFPGQTQMYDSAYPGSTYGVELGRYDPMTAMPDSYTLEDDLRLDVPSGFGVLANDTDGPDGSLRPGAAVLVDLPKHGWLTLRADGSFTYQPFSNDFSGTDSFTYMATSHGDQTGPATVTIAIDLVNQAPVAMDDSGSGRPGRSVRINVLANDSDPDHDTLSIDSFTQGTSGSVRQSRGILIYTPNSRGTMTDMFTYSVRDPRGGISIASVFVYLDSQPMPKVVSAKLSAGTETVDLLKLPRRVLPFATLTRISVTFSGDVSITPDDLRIVGVGGVEYALSGFGYDGTTHTASWSISLDSNRGLDDRLTFFVNGSATGVTNGGVPIGDWSQTVNILTGDLNGDGVVSQRDTIAIKNKFGADLGARRWADVDGDGVVDGTDLSLAMEALGNRLV